MSSLKDTIVQITIRMEVSTMTIQSTHFHVKLSFFLSR